MFAGAERDGDSSTKTGFDYLGARYYSSLFGGRFTTPDSSAFVDPDDPQSLNLYTYVYNNPIRYIDPMGRLTIRAGVGEAGFDEDTLEWYRQTQDRLNQQIAAAQTANRVQGLLPEQTST